MVNTSIGGRFLASERARLGLRQADVADLMGLSRSRISNIETLERVPDAFARRYLGAINGDDLPLLKLAAVFEEILSAGAEP